jgi:endoglucanase
VADAAGAQLEQQQRTQGDETMDSNKVAVGWLARVMTCALCATAGAGCAGDQPASPAGGGAPGVSSDTESVTADLTVADSSRTLSPETRFFVPAPDPGAVDQFFDLLRSRHATDALRIAELEETPRAAWFTSGTPQEVERAVRETVREASRAHRIPVLVAYNIPFRDCAQYSAGGATDTAAYEAWIDGFARGIGHRKAVVILEPDGLGIIPYNTTIFGAADWCKPTVTDDQGNVVPAPGANPTERYAQLNYAVDSIGSQAPRALAYLDGTHSSWLGVPEAAYRLVTAGVQRAQGFFLNVSNYQPTDQLAQFGTWVSDCITAATAGAPWAAGHFDWCPAQYDPATNYTTVNYSPEFAAAVTAGLANLMGGATATTHFVLDTGRNGRGPWQPTVAYPDAQVWCNAPHSGAGLRPTAATGIDLADALLWIKTPGQSDGSCNRGVAGATTDPEWGGIVDPAAGVWFPQQALELATLADPTL